MKTILTLFILFISIKSFATGPTGETPGTSGGTQTQICTDPGIAQAPPRPPSDDSETGSTDSDADRSSGF